MDQFANFTEDQLRAAARRAFDAGDKDAARRLMEFAQQRTAQPEPERPNTLDLVRRNVFGGSEPGQETPGERLGTNINEFAQSYFPGVVRGASELVGLPGTIANGMDWLAERAGLIPEGVNPGNPLSGSALRGYADRATRGWSESQGDSTAAKYGSTIGEFTPGALGAGTRGLLAFGLAPGAASEFAGQATEGTAIEPLARAGAAIGTGLLAGPLIGPRAQGVRTPGATPEQRAAAERLRAQGIEPTAGQIMNSPRMRQTFEGTAGAIPKQREQFTVAAMRSIGSDAKRATPEALVAAERQIVQQMDDVLRGVNIVPNSSHLRRANKVVADYIEGSAARDVVPRIGNIAARLEKSASSGKPIPLATLREWRSNLGKLTTNDNEAMRKAAHGLRDTIDRMTDSALTAAGRQSDIPVLEQARQQYRNFIAVTDASTRAGTPGMPTSTLSPEQLKQSIIRSQGRRNYALDQGTDLMRTTRDAEGMLRTLPTVSPGGIRGMAGLPIISSSGLGGATGFAISGTPAGAAIGAAAGAAVPTVGQAFMRSRLTQNILNNPQFAAGNFARTGPGLLAGTTEPEKPRSKRQRRKSRP